MADPILDPETAEYPTPSHRSSQWLLVTAFVSIILLFVFIELIPTTRKASDPAEPLGCVSNLRLIGLGLSGYANANGGRFPPTLDLLIESPDPNIHVEVERFVCSTGNDTPASGSSPGEIAKHFREEPHHLSYFYVGAGFTSDAESDQVIMYEDLHAHHHHDKGVSILFGDGHSEFLPLKEAEKRIAESAAAHVPPASQN